MKAMRLEAITNGYGGYEEHPDVLAGFEVVMPGGWRGVGTTLDEARRAAELARTTHEARVNRLRIEAERKWKAWRSAHADRDVVNNDSQF